MPAQATWAPPAEHPFDRSWLLQLPQLLSFSWITPLLQHGRRTTLSQKDLFPLPREEHASQCTQRVADAWDRQCDAFRRREQRRAQAKGGPALRATPPPKFIFAILTAHKLLYFYVLLSYSLEAALRVLQAWLVGRVVGLLRAGNETGDAEAYAYALGILLANLGYVRACVRASEQASERASEGARRRRSTSASL